MTEATAWRYERKYRISAISQSVVLSILRQHPAGFRTAYPDRWVNNIYFDTPDLAAYRDNVAGVAQRRKHRLRWYGRPLREMQAPVLETKIKNNQLGSKQSIPMTSTFSVEEKATWLSQARARWGYGEELSPTLLNSYHRSYYVDASGRFRLTLDTDMCYGFARAPFRLPYQDTCTVIEVKYPAELADAADALVQGLPFRATKHSKYVTGVELVWG